MVGNDEPKILHKKGLKYNGFRIPWTFVSFGILLIFNAGVVWMAFLTLQNKVAELEDRPTNSRALAVLETKMENVERKIDAHIRWRHQSD